MDARLFEKREYRNGSELFSDRAGAGGELAGFLAPAYGCDADGQRGEGGAPADGSSGSSQTGSCAESAHPGSATSAPRSGEPAPEPQAGSLILAIPSGGVPVGIEISRRLGIPLDVCIVRKLQIPWNPEAGFGAVTLEGDVLLNEPLVSELGLDERERRGAVEQVQEQLRRRNRLFRDGREPAEVEGRTVILTDDGIASGYTMAAALSSVRRRGAARIVVAVPTAPEEALERLGRSADEIYSLHVQYGGGSFAVAAAYRNWRDLREEEVVRMLQEYRAANP